MVVGGVYTTSLVLGEVKPWPHRATSATLPSSRTSLSLLDSPLDWAQRLDGAVRITSIMTKLRSSSEPRGIRANRLRWHVVTRSMLAGFTIAAFCVIGSLGGIGQAAAATAARVFDKVRSAKLHPVPLWPSYLPAKIAGGDWWVETIRGRGRYGRTPISALNGFELYFSYPFEGEFGGGGFARTNRKGLNAILRSGRAHYQPPPRHIRLGGRRVIVVRPGDTGTAYAFSTHGGVYVYETKDFGGPSQRTIGRMIRSMRPMSHLRPPK